MQSPPAKTELWTSDGKFYFDEPEAQRWVDWFELFLTHVDGALAKEPIKLAKWQKDDWIRPLFGWKRRNGTRRYRTAFIFLPRKNGKSIITAGIALGMLHLDKEPGAQIYVAASNEDQAHVLFDMAKCMIEQSDDLKQIFEVYEDHIYHPKSRGVFKVITGTPKGKHGFNVHGAIIDEYHEQPDPKLRKVLRTGMPSRRQPLFIYLSTAGDDVNTPCHKEYTRAKNYKLGIGPTNDTYFQLIYEADPEDDWQVEATWKKANPNYGIGVYPEYYEEAVAEILEQPAELNDFKQLHLNMWVESAASLMPLELWRSRKAKYTIADLLGKECYGGMDLADTDDMAAFSLCFPSWRFEKRVIDEVEQLIPVLSVRPLTHYFLPRGAFKYNRKNAHTYTDWERAGLLTVTDGDVLDYGYIEQYILDVGKKFRINQIGYDPWKGTEIVQRLQDTHGFKMVKMRQGMQTMSPPTERLLTLVKAKEIDHDDNPIFNWNVANAAIVTDINKNKMITKEKSAGKIDGLAAFLMALGIAITQAPPKQSIYATRGVISA